MKTKLLFIISLFTLGLVVLSGCVSEESGATLENSTVTKLEDGKNINLEDTVKQKEVKLSRTINVNNVAIPIETTYGIDEKSYNNWKFTQQSTITLSIKSNQKSDFELGVNNLYSDVSIIGSKTRTHSLRQDSMNMSWNSMPQGSISFDNVNDFSIPFQVEGLNQNETSFYVYNGYGSSSTSRITESDLIDNGALGGKLTVVWSVLITDKATNKNYIKTFTDSIALPIQISKDSE